MADRYNKTLRPSPLLLGRKVQQRADREPHLGCDQDPQTDDRIHGAKDHGRGCDPPMKQFEHDRTARR